MTDTPALSQFEELVLHIVDSAGDPELLGAVKLNKILWFSDCAWFREHNLGISGTFFVRAPQGPLSPQVDRAVRRLVKAGALEETRGKGNQRLFVAKRSAHLATFSGDQIALIDKVTNAICLQHTAQTISHLTHGLGWEVAANGEDLPLNLVYVSDHRALPNDQVGALMSAIDVDADEWAKQVPLSVSH